MPTRTFSTAGLRAALLMFLVVVCWGWPLLATAADEQERREKIAQLGAESKKLRALIAKFKSERSQLQRALQKSETDIGVIQKKTRKILKQISLQQKELELLKERRSTLSEQKQKQQKIISQQIAAAYQMGQQKKIKILLNQEQPNKVTRALTYYDYFNRARNQQIDNYVSILSELDHIEPKIVTRAQNLSDTKTKLEEERLKLIETIESRELSLVKITSSISNKDQRLRQINADRRKLEQLLEAVEQSLANIVIPGNNKPFTSLKGKLPWPVKGKIKHSFGSSRSGTALRWQGVKIQAKQGSPVEAIHRGRIVFADWFRGSGLLVIIDHGNGYMSLYAHNQSLLRETGEWVNAGEEIATVGNSGGQKNASLYFEIRHNGKPANPAKWCKRA